MLLLGADRKKKEDMIEPTPIMRSGSNQSDDLGTLFVSPFLINLGFTVEPLLIIFLNDPFVLSPFA